MAGELLTADQEFLQRWRLVLQLASGSDLAPEYQTPLAHLVTTIERWAVGLDGLTLSALRTRYALSVHQQRMIATALVDRRSRFNAGQLASIAWLTPEPELDWDVVGPSLAWLEEVGLLRAMDGEVRSRLTRYAAGPELAELARVARGQVLLTVPDLSAVPALFRHGVVPWHLLEGTHLHFFNQTSLAHELRALFRSVTFLRAGEQFVNGTRFYTSVVALCAK